MPDEIMAVNERLTRLEVTVATGFSELRAEIGAKTSSLESRLRVLIEASRDEQRLATEGLGAALDRIEARLTQMPEEYVQTRNDHASALQDHDRRIGALERRQSDSSPAI